MLGIIRNLLQQIIDDIDSGNSNISEQKQLETIDLIKSIITKELSKTEASNYIGVCRATFDNYVNKGYIPKGIKRQGISSKLWNKSDLDKFLELRLQNKIN